MNDNKNKAAFIILHGFDPDAVNSITGEKGEHVAVVLERTPDTPSSPIRYSAVGGFHKEGETSEQAARREANEELVGLIDITKNALSPLSNYVSRQDTHIESFACELTLEQLRVLQKHAAMTSPDNPIFNEAYSTRFTRNTDNEIARVRVMPFEQAINLPFYEPQAAGDYRAVKEKIQKQSPWKVHYKDVENLFQQNVVPDPSSLWVLVKIPPIATDPTFAPHPETDQNGNPIGVTSVMSENGKSVAIFRNPKDSLDGKHSTQKLPLDGSGVLILPIKHDQEFGRGLLDIAKDFAENPSLDALDKLLKDVRFAYLDKGKVPDMYNANTGHYDVMQLQSSTENDGTGIYNKKPIPYGLIVLKAESPVQEIEFTSNGKFIEGGKQFGRGEIVLVYDRVNQEIRKMAPDYAVENFVFPSGKQITLGELPTFSPNNDGLKIVNFPDRGTFNTNTTGEMTMDNTKIQQAIAIAADDLHEAWKEAYHAQNGAGAARWKPMKPASVEWVQQNAGNIPAEAIRDGASGKEINIAALKNSQLPPQFSGENTASAKGAIEAIISNPSANIDALASIVHDQWVERNGSWAAEELKKPYAELPDAEQEKDRAVVRVAQSALKSVGIGSPDTQGHDGSVSSPEQKRKLG